MGRMKNVYMEVIQANNGLPENLTIGDMLRMEELKIYEWKEYEREKEKREYYLKNSDEVKKTEQAKKKFSPNYGETHEKRN